jgi:hypothetical protein
VLLTEYPTPLKVWHPDGFKSVRRRFGVLDGMVASVDQGPPCEPMVNMAVQMSLFKGAPECA